MSTRIFSVEEDRLSILRIDIRARGFDMNDTFNSGSSVSPRSSLLSSFNIDILRD